MVIGGNYDVDMELTSPNGQALYKDVKKKYDHYSWTTDVKGEYRFCFSNEFSTFTHKVVYFDFQVGDEPFIIPETDAHATAMTHVSLYIALVSSYLLNSPCVNNFAKSNSDVIEPIYTKALLK